MIVILLGALLLIGTKPGGKRLVHATLALAHRRGEAFAPRDQRHEEPATQMLRPYPRGYEQCPSVVHSDLEVD